VCRCSLSCAGLVHTTPDNMPHTSQLACAYNRYVRGAAQQRFTDMSAIVSAYLFSQGTVAIQTRRVAGSAAALQFTPQR
jgi:hypothetical protein